MSNTKVRYPAVEQFIDNNKDALVRSVQEIVRFPSVEAPAAGPGAPFGEAVRGALENALNLGKSFGFETTNLDGYAGCIDYGCGEEMLGVVAHVDVVPEGEGWIHPPYAAEIADGRIYGRGTMDDKGPAVCAIYALAAIKAAGIPMRRRVRIILGTNEETGWGCMDHYRKVAEIPTIYYKNSSLEKAIDYLFIEVDRAIREGANILILSDRGVDEYHVAMPSLLVLSGLQQHLVRTKKRTSVGIVLETGEPREVHHFATLIGYGACAINPYLAHESIKQLIDTDMLQKDYYAAVDDYNNAVLSGIVKIASKMGISLINILQILSAELAESELKRLQQIILRVIHRHLIRSDWKWI